MVAQSKPQPTRHEALLQALDALPRTVVGEILDGELYVTPRPAPPHAQVESVATADLIHAFQRKPGGDGPPGGWWIYVEPEIRMGQRVLVPDIAGWRRERMPHRPTTAHFDLAPDWVCEIASPRTWSLDRHKKLPAYADWGVPWVWLIDPVAQEIQVLHRQGEHWIAVGWWGGPDPEARVPPFDAVPLDLTRWWEDGREGEGVAEAVGSYEALVAGP